MLWENVRLQRILVTRIACVTKEESLEVMGNEKFGIALIERPLLRTLESLWEGPVFPANLPSIERAIRALLTARTLNVNSVARIPPPIYLYT